MFKIYLEPLSPRLLQNRKAHIYYLKHTREQADVLRGIVKQAKVKQPLDNELDFACKQAKRIQELLVYVRDTCPNAIKLSAKKVAVTPMNKVKKVRFSEPLTSSSNIKQYTLMHMMPVVEVFDSSCGINAYDDAATSVQYDPKVVLNVLLNKDVEQDYSLVYGLSLGSFLWKLAAMAIWKFLEITSAYVETPKPEIRRPKQIKSVGSSKKPKIVESKIANNSKPNHLWGSNATDVTSSSSLVNDRLSRLSSVRFRNDQIVKIMGYGDYQLGNVIISRVYYIEGLGHNLFSVGQFYDADVEVAFQKNTCFIQNLNGVDLLSGSRDSNLYTISLDDMLKTSSICLLSKASKTKSWLWHRRLSHLNFGTLNKLAKDGLARGIPKLKFQKDHLCSACALGKSKKSSHQPKSKDTNQKKLYLLHMDLYGPMRMGSINEKKYILVIVDDYS
ncbi:retrovirus-related pol polyprotein from transposon TNT 1-94 [Tanacetum coccineum]